MLEPADSLSQTPEQPEEEAPRRKRKPTGGLECQLGFLLGLSLLGASRLGQLWIAFDVFAHFTLQFAVLTLGFLIGMVMPRAKLLTAFVVMVIGIVAIGAWPHLASREPRVVGEVQQGERALKVASFNTLWVNNNADAVRAEIERLDADVITLIEMGPAKRPILGQLKSRYPYQFHCYDVDYCKFAILSKLPFTDAESRGRWAGPPYIRLRLGPEAGGLTVFGVHTIRFPHSLAQFRQVTQIAKVIERTAGPRLVMGDFNATPFSRILGVLQDSANLMRLTNLPTWPSQAGLPQIAIDHIFVSPGIRLLEAEQIGEPAGSDHYPVTVRIAVPASP
ncbi:MAG: endonuclease/exonuclease/phosphatase family protein [Aestuariivirga sp.]|uniref:endonuclease/exonuclease/phosphatase family protein n=1 Tax=Aestuariivirga sp. TaxID=2650926 RepID=UPI00301A2C6D